MPNVVGGSQNVGVDNDLEGEGYPNWQRGSRPTGTEKVSTKDG